MTHLIYCYALFYGNNLSIVSETWNESFHDDPLFFFHFWVLYMYIFNFVKGQDNFNSRPKMAHLPLSMRIAPSLPNKLRKNRF